jgi:BASS family bile acid:Na+ symporter
MSNVELVFTILIPAILVIMMFGMGLSLTLQDFRRVVRYPTAAVIGLGGQLLLLPSLAFVLALLLNAPAEIAIGGMLLAACPGGITSNGYMFVSRGDLGLSVTLTAITSIVTILTIPLVTWFALRYFLDQGQVPDLPALQVMQRLVLLTAVPIGAGMLVRHRWSEAAMRASDAIRRVSLLLLILIIVSATVGTFDTIVDNLLTAGLLAICLNLSSMAAGYFLARGCQLPDPQVRAITFEIGVQNLSLAVLVAVPILKRPEFAVLAVVYAFVMKVSVLTLIYVWRNRPGMSPAVN